MALRSILPSPKSPDAISIPQTHTPVPWPVPELVKNGLSSISIGAPGATVNVQARELCLVDGEVAAGVEGVDEQLHRDEGGGDVERAAPVARVRLVLGVLGAPRGA